MSHITTAFSVRDEQTHERWCWTVPGALFSQSVAEPNVIIGWKLYVLIILSSGDSVASMFSRNDIGESTKVRKTKTLHILRLVILAGRRSISFSVRSLARSFVQQQPQPGPLHFWQYEPRCPVAGCQKPLNRRGKFYLNIEACSIF